MLTSLQAFRKVPHVDPANKHKKGFIWVLESSAIGKGIESTTRYRQKTVWRRNDTSDVIDTKRQRSGRKGGRAARQSAKLRRSAKLDSRRPRRTQRFEKLESDSSSNASFAATRPTSPGGSYCHLGGLPYYLNTAPTKSLLPGRALDNYRKTVVSTSLPTNQTFFGNAPNNNDIYQGNKSAGIQGISGLAAHT